LHRFRIILHPGKFLNLWERRLMKHKPLISLIGASLLLTPATAVAAATSGTAVACAQAKHHYVDAKSATLNGKLVKVKGHRATFHCGGEDDGFYTAAKSTETLTLHQSAVVKVFKNPEDPSGYKQVQPSALRYWLKHNKSQSIYRVTGHHSDITKLVEEFVP
jgi:hypothetical protein